MSATAELLADCGAAAESHDLFRSRPFFDAEGVTHTLRLDSPGRLALVPLIVRDVEGSDLLDAVSPYAYPGASVSGAGAAPAAHDFEWSETGLISIFGRERLAAAPWLAADDERSTVLLHDPRRERRLRPRLAEQIRANVRDGWRGELVTGPDSTAPARDAFAVAYAQTMTRAAAAERYFFAREYFDAILSFERSWLVAATREGEYGAGAIAAISDGILHYYLGGTADSALRASPFKNVIAAMLDLADELDLALNLGGGITAGDGLEEFKRGFANADLPFFIHEVVCDASEYDRLSAERDGADFFPAYRAG